MLTRPIRNIGRLSQRLTGRYPRPSSFGCGNRSRLRVVASPWSVPRCGRRRPLIARGRWAGQRPGRLRDRLSGGARGVDRTACLGHWKPRERLIGSSLAEKSPSDPWLHRNASSKSGRATWSCNPVQSGSSVPTSAMRWHAIGTILFLSDAAIVVTSAANKAARCNGGDQQT